tara:strand:- start:24 stop:242 length:219 start_codon:yes stop_codon:yes gene_type:complete
VLPGTQIKILPRGPVLRDFLFLRSSERVIALVATSFAFSAKAHNLGALRMLWSKQVRACRRRRAHTRRSEAR